ncbi:kinase-like domain-containing protein [Rhizoctonia solani]|nr:kinase-like domain-containing protein [Rhizoctonia solani]
MSATEILRRLDTHHCRDISEELDILRTSELPVSTGGFGDVYCATLRNGDRVALKCIRMQVGFTPEGEKFLKKAAHELYVWSKCKHPNILELSGVTLFYGRVAMVSPWVDNGHLRWFLEHNPQANRCTLCANIADGVDYLHKRGIIHGDLKPENILIAKDHTPKLTDFGNAALSEYTLQFSQSNATQNMTLRWAAPEIVKGITRSTPEGDIYALGMVIFETISGTLPYEGLMMHTILYKIMSGETPGRPEAHIPTEIEQADRLWVLIKSCWAQTPLERPKAYEVKNVMDVITPEGLLANRE